MNKSTVICFGEVLWDLLPSGKLAGGAPMNVAYHLNNFGIPTKMISRIGADDLGKEIQTFLNKKGVDTELLQTDSIYPTGTVKVTLTEKGSPSYEIVNAVAWDYINQDADNLKAVKEAAAFVFGSLAARSHRTKETLLGLLAVAKLKVFDVNLRIPFYSKALLEKFLEQADIVKMNDEELTLIGDWYFDEKEEISLALKLKNKFKINILIVTKGSKGAFLLDPAHQVKSVAAKKITVADTIGSGDSFFAGFLSQYLNNVPLIDCLDFAARTGALVATKRGGTPKITKEMVVSLA